MSTKPEAPWKYALVILRYRSCPAVSQICSLISLSPLEEWKGAKEEVKRECGENNVQDKAER